MAPLNLQWSKQIGSAADDDILSISLESSGSIFVGGFTRGQLPGNQSAGSTDAFLARFDAKGQQLWLKQIGSNRFDKFSAIQTDVRRAVYAAGFTEGQLGDQPNQGFGDALIMKYDTLGNQIWVNQWGTPSSESIRGIDVDRQGNLFVVGASSGSIEEIDPDGSINGFLGKLDAEGNLLWLKSLKKFSVAYVEAVCVDPQGNIYVGGYSEGDFDREADAIRSDGIILKYDTNGEVLWRKEIGYQFSDGVVTMACTQRGDLYVGGFIMELIGPLEPENFRDRAFVGKYNSEGDQLWVREIDQTNFDWVISLDVDEKEHVYVGGYLRRKSQDNFELGDTDAFMAKYDPAGVQLWLHKFGTEEEDGIQALAVDRQGAIYVAGYTYGQIGEESPQGGRDAFLAKYTQISEQMEEPERFPVPAVPPVNNIPLVRPAFSEILPVQVQTVLDFLNNAQTPADLTNIELYRPDLAPEDLASYSIGQQGAQNLLDARAALPGNQFNSLDQVLSVPAIGEDKILDIVDFIWLPTEELFRQELFRNVLGSNWVVDYWRYVLSPEAFTRLEETPSLLQDFVAREISSIARERSGNFIIGSLAKALLEKTFPDRVESLTALTQFASWWFRFDEDNWFSFDTISEFIDPFLNYYNRELGSYINPVFYRGFQNGGTVADGISPDDLVVTLNSAERAITIWGISLFD